MNITINGNVTINTTETTEATEATETTENSETTETTQAAKTAETQQEEHQPIDRTNEVLISNETTFHELLKILGASNAVAEAARTEAELKKAEAREVRLRKLYGKDYDELFGEDDQAKIGKATRRPRPYELRNSVPMIARIELPDGGYCEVFGNGYSIYDNGNRKCVVWVPDCESVTYFFGQLKESEKEYQDQQKEITEDVLGPLPWYHAVIIGGENRIEFNMAHPKSKGNASDLDDHEEWEKPGKSRWSCGARYPSPEEAYLEKEEKEERRQKVRDEVKNLTEKQREAIEMCFFKDMTQEEAARKLGKAQSTVNGRIKKGKKALEENLKNIF